jgi:alanyl-tRNA synthetase
VLHDTYGFPIDLTLEMAAEQGLTVDEDEFRRLMQQQRERAKADAASRKTGHVDVSAYRALLDRAGPTEFTGYEHVTDDGHVRGVLLDGDSAEAAEKGDDVELVLDRTPFYAEGGGQLADEGLIRVGDGALIRVRDVQTPIPGLIVHRGTVVEGELRVGTDAHSEVDVARREAVSRAHTATHMTHKAFREALGETASQAGSENAPGRFRFDFAAPEAVAPSVLSDVEQRVNEMLVRDLEVSAEILGLDEARRRGAMALFGEKYGDEVRVVSVGDWATELCGGTHVHHSGQLGVVKLLSESSIGAGVRRVEALVGLDAYKYLATTQALVSLLTDTLKVRPEELPERVASISARLREAEKEIERLRLDELLHAAPALAEGAADVAGAAVVTYRSPAGTTVDDLRRLALDVRDRLPRERPGVVAVTGLTNGRPNILVAVNDRGQAAGLRANELVRPAANALGGGGGGKADVAQGGGTSADALDDAVREVQHQVAQVLGAAR